MVSMDLGDLVVEDDDDDDRGLPPGLAALLMWLIYRECAVCGAPAKTACAGLRFGPHPGRPTRWETT